MENAIDTHKPMNSKGASIFRIMLEEKKAMSEHLQSGGNLDDILDKIKRNHDAVSAHLKNGGKLEDFKSQITAA